MSNFWNTDDAKKLHTLLEKVEQPWSYKFMSKINNLVPITGLEVVIFRGGKKGNEVLLTRRDDDDIDWPGQYHIPGSIVRDTDVGIDDDLSKIYNSILRRIFSGELGFSEEQIKCVKYNQCDVVIWKHTRGGSVSIIFICKADDVDFSVGKFYSVDDLPQPFIKGQEIVINTALKHINEILLEDLID